MQIYDQMGFKSEFTAALDKDGREFLLLVIKGTFDFPDHPSSSPIKSKEQTPLTFADEATGEPGFSATRLETDFAHRKPKCDIVLDGAAYAPRGEPVDRVRVGLKVGNWTKSFDVLGERHWTSLGVTFAPSYAAKFLRQPISYDVAFGGVDRLNKDDKAPPSFARNPVGTGWASTANRSLTAGLRLPNTQAVDETIDSPFGDYAAMSFGPMGRGWPGRLEYGGTYDQKWIDNVFPFLPQDFDDRYYQMAPPDQQVAEINDGDEIILANLTPGGKENFRLSGTELPVKIFRGRDEVFDGNLKPDTLLFAPEDRRFSLVWRVSLPVKRIITEFSEAWIGPPTKAMLKARDEGRSYIRAVATAPSEAELE